MTQENTQLLRVALVEDDDRLRANLIALIERTPGFRCVGAFPDAKQALAHLLDAEPDVVLMDLNLPGLSGVECIRALKTRSPKTQFLVLTVYEDIEMVFSALKAGAAGYLLKRAIATELAAAIRDVFNGGAPMTGLIARKVVDSFHPPQSAAADLPKLSPREREILEALAKGCLYKEISEQCQIGVSTVRTHIKSIYEKLQVQNRTEAARKLLSGE